MTLAQSIAARLKRGGKILVCGNGGSAAQAQHFAAELMGRYKRERAPIPAIALTADTALITALANDYGYETVFERQVKALCNPEDVVIGISTSGTSPNVRRALEARPPGAMGVAFVGAAGSPIEKAADAAVSTTEGGVAMIQEFHLCELHDLAGEIEELCLHE